MKLSIIMAVYNEKRTIRQVIAKVIAVPIKKELIIIDDGSTDGTREILKKEYNNNKDIVLLFHNKNKGKGWAIRTGLKKVAGDVIIFQDGDLELDPMDYLKLIKPIQNKKSHVVYGSRFLTNKIPKGSFYIGVKFLTWMANFLYQTNITDEATCYKMFTKESLSKVNLQCEKFEFCPEVTAKIRKAGYEIVEVPIYYRPRSKAEGKKINLADGLQAIYTLLKYRIKK